MTTATAVAALTVAELTALNILRAATAQQRALQASDLVWFGHATALRTAAAARILGRLEGLGLVKSTAYGFIAPKEVA